MTEHSLSMTEQCGVQLIDTNYRSIRMVPNASELNSFLTQAGLIQSGRTNLFCNFNATICGFKWQQVHNRQEVFSTRAHEAHIFMTITTIIIRNRHSNRPPTAWNQGRCQARNTVSAIPPFCFSALAPNTQRVCFYFKIHRKFSSNQIFYMISRRFY